MQQLTPRIVKPKAISGEVRRARQEAQVEEIRQGKKEERSQALRKAATGALEGEDEEEMDAVPSAAAPPEPMPVVPTTSPAAGPIGNKLRANEAIKALFRVFAKSDFKHDFGEKDTGRDWITNADRGRFGEMVQKFPVKQRTALLNKFDAKFPRPPSGNPKDAKGDNLYELLKAEIASELYPDPAGNAAEFQRETDVLDQIGINYEAIKGRIATHFSVPTEEVFTEGADFGHGGLARKYTVRAQKYKNPDGSTRNLSSLFQNVTGGKTNFGLLVDAATGLSVTLIGDSTLSPPPDRSCNFVILQNVESDADSATGASDFKVPKAPGPNPASVAILRDVGTSTVIFPIWSDEEPSSRETENLFTKIQIILNRVEKGEIEASILIGDRTFSIPDVGTTSNVKNASLNGLISLFAKDILTDLNERDEATRKPYLYALLKRMGDWCQALSLLDRVRTYTALDPKTRDPLKGAGGEKITPTLQGLIADGYEIGLVTNDRILLAYATLLGLNVYFTSASPLNCLIYFKNEDDVSNAADVEARITDIATNLLPRLLEGVLGAPLTTGDVPSLIAAIQARGRASLDPPNFEAVVGPVVANLTRAKIPDSALRVLDPIARAFASKVCLANLGELRTNFGELEVQFNASMTNYLGGGDVKTRYDGITNAAAALNKYKTDIEHNTVVLQRMAAGKHGGSYGSDESVFFDLAVKMGAGSRSKGTEQMARAKNILLTMRDDIKQIQQKALTINLGAYIPPVPGIDPAVAGRNTPENVEALYEAFDAVRPLLPAATTGGGRMTGGALTAAELERALTQRRVFPFTSINFGVAIKRLTEAASKGDRAADLFLKALDNSPAVKRGDYYRDEKSRPYSVVDSVLITREDRNVLLEQLRTLPAVPAEWQEFIVYRSMLLYHDILYAQLEKIRDEPGIERERVVNKKTKKLVPRVPEDEDVMYTEGALVGSENVVREASLLRYAADQLVRKDVQHGNAIGIIINGLEGGGVDEESLGKIAESVEQGTTLFGPALNPSSFEGRLASTKTYLQNVRTTVQNNYAPRPAIEVEDDPIKKTVINEATIDKRIDDAATLPAPAPVPPPVAPPVAPAAVGPPAFTFRDPRQFAAVPGQGAAGQGMDVGGGGLQTADPVPSNAGGTRTNSSRRGLYARLRQRAGEGTPPGV
jgi:hypothetical protein